MSYEGIYAPTVNADHEIECGETIYPTMFKAGCSQLLQMWK